MGFGHRTAVARRSGCGEFGENFITKLFTSTSKCRMIREDMGVGARSVRQGGSGDENLRTGRWDVLLDELGGDE